jgi:hypothetical protein
MIEASTSRALREPSAWELAQYRQGDKVDRQVWERSFDESRFAYAAPDALCALESEIRHRELWCGARPTLAARSVPTELVRMGYHLMRNSFSWARADVRFESAAKVVSFSDRVADGIGARAIDAFHAFTQPTSGTRVAAVATSALANGREVATFTGTQWYVSTLAAQPWSSLHNLCTAFMIVVPKLLGTTQVILETVQTPGATNGIQFNRGAAGTGFGVYRATGGVFGFNLGGAVVNVLEILEMRIQYGTAPYFYGQRGATSNQLAGTGSAGAYADATQTLTFGDRFGGVAGTQMLFADLLVNFAVSTAYTAQVRRYALLRYALS